jgi:hypothetical protein
MVKNFRFCIENRTALSLEVSIGALTWRLIVAAERPSRLVVKKTKISQFFMDGAAEPP